MRRFRGCRLGELKFVGELASCLHRMLGTTEQNNPARHVASAGPRNPSQTHDMQLRSLHDQTSGCGYARGIALDHFGTRFARRPHIKWPVPDPQRGWHRQAHISGFMAVYFAPRATHVIHGYVAARPGGVITRSPRRRHSIPLAQRMKMRRGGGSRIPRSHKQDLQIWLLSRGHA
jgi:hypothetical protein